MRARQEIPIYNFQQRTVHWIHTVAFILLLITGLLVFVPSLSFLMGGSAISRYIHRIFAVVYMIVPFFFLFADPEGVRSSLRTIFTWSGDDWQWLKAMPSFYFLGRGEEKMPPQEKFNTGQKAWYLLVFLASFLIIVSGLVMWIGRELVGVGVYQTMLTIHDLSMIPLVIMFFVHVYVGVFHPVMASGTLFRNPMISGMTDAEYARKHHTKWYQRVTKEK